VKVVPIKDQITPNDILEYSKDKYTALMIIGYGLEGELQVMHDESLRNSEDMLWIMERFKHFLLSEDFIELD